MKRKKKSKAIEWYIRGEYHCDKCPFCFGGEYLPGCDDYEDAGCYIFGDLRDTCRLIPPIRFILGWGKRKKMQYIENHQYDGVCEYMEERFDKEQKFRKAFREQIDAKYAICHKDSNGEILKGADGKPYALDEDCYVDSVYKLGLEAENIFHQPKPYEPLRKKWAALIKETWHRFIGVFKPYFYT